MNSPDRIAADTERSQAINAIETVQSDPNSTQAEVGPIEECPQEDFQLSGSTVFPGFVEITRNDAPGQKLICFNQFRSHFFKYLARGTLSGWVHKLNIQKWKCTDKEQQIFKTIVPEEKGKPLYLIKRENGLQLLRHHSERQRDLDARACLYNRNNMASGFLTSPPTLVYSAAPFAAAAIRDAPLPASPKSGPSTACAVDIAALPTTMPRDEQRRNSWADNQYKADDERHDMECVLHHSTKDAATTKPALVPSAVQLATKAIRDAPLPASPQSRPSTACAVHIAALPSTMPRDEQDGDEEYLSSDTEASFESGRFGRGSAGGKLHSLSEKDMTLTLKKQLESLAAFYEKHYEGRRKGGQLSPITINKICERLKMFFHYVKYSRKLEPDISQVTNSLTIRAYGRFLSEVRDLKSVTIARHMYAIEKCLMFAMRNNSATERDDSQAMSAMKNIRLQCDKISRLDNMRNREGIGCPPKQNLVYEEILQLCKDLKSSFEDETNQFRKARFLHDLLLMLIYLHFVPRAHEVRTLIVEANFPADKIVPVGPNRENVIVLYNDGSVELILTKYKTDKFYGPCKIPVPFDSAVSYYLKQYVHKYRATLLVGADHSFMFVTARGNEFPSSGSFSKYLCQIIEQGTGKRGSTNSLRHAIATKFVSDPDLCENQAFRASLCRVMRHSRQTQDKCYVDLTNAAKSQEALCVLSQSASNEIFEDCFSSKLVSAKSDDGNSGSDCNDELQASIGDLVALVDPQSTREEPVIFIAKVMRFNAGDRNEVVLAEFEEVEDSCYKLKIQNYRPWVESAHSLIWPIDVKYDSEARVYKLRSSKQEIFQSVLSSPKKKRKTDGETIPRL